MSILSEIEFTHELRMTRGYLAVCEVAGGLWVALDELLVEFASVISSRTERKRDSASGPLGLHLVAFINAFLYVVVYERLIVFFFFRIVYGKPIV